MLGNIIWLIFGGLFSAFGWFIVGALWCLTIIGIPFGVQSFKIAGLTLLPFGKNIEYKSMDTGNLLGNILWIIFGGIELAFGHLVLALLLAITIIGIPFAKQHIKLAKLSLVPFGAIIM